MTLTTGVGHICPQAESRFSKVFKRSCRNMNPSVPGPSNMSPLEPTRKKKVWHKYCHSYIPPILKCPSFFPNQSSYALLEFFETFQVYLCLALVLLSTGHGLKCFKSRKHHHFCFKHFWRLLTLLLCKKIVDNKKEKGILLFFIGDWWHQIFLSSNSNLGAWG